jgi:hypothetical protein
VHIGLAFDTTHAKVSEIRNTLYKRTSLDKQILFEFFELFSFTESHVGHQHCTRSSHPPFNSSLLVMVWLDGKPILLKTLAWPADDPDLTRQGRKRQGWSVLDDQILFWRAFSSSENPRTVVYTANTKSARDTQSETVSLERVAELDYAAHRLAIVPDVGFVTAQWRFVYLVCIIVCRTEFLA